MDEEIVEVGKGKMPTPVTDDTDNDDADDVPLPA